jgi:hypothetical protein
MGAHSTLILAARMILLHVVPIHLLMPGLLLPQATPRRRGVSFILPTLHTVGARLIAAAPQLYSGAAQMRKAAGSE